MVYKRSLRSGCSGPAATRWCLPLPVLATVLAVATLGCVAAGRIQAAEPDSRPNIVLIMADDMGFSDLGCYGGEVRTPVLDRLAAEGMRFSHFYNNAKCTTTRASLITGLYPRRPRLLTRNMVTLGEVLQAAGYQTALIGKWHLGSGPDTHPIHRGFDRYYGLLDGCCNFFDPKQPDPPFKGGRVRRFAENLTEVTEFPEDFYTTDAFTDHAIQAIRDFAPDPETPDPRPFFLHLCYTAPHYPLHARPEDVEPYRGSYRMGWDELRRQRYRRLIDLGLIDARWHLSAEDSESYDWATADQVWEDSRMAVYAAMIECMDRNIGRLWDELERSGVADNTLVLFLSDNGGCAEEPGGRDTTAVPGSKEHYTAVGPAWGWAQNSPFRRYKSWVHEGGISTPLIAWWPGSIAPNSLQHEVGHLIDLMPTLLELAGGRYPESYAGHAILPVEGQSLVPLFQGKTRPSHERLYWEWAGNRAVREGKWKLVWDKRVRDWELYDLESDRTETRNLAAEDPERVERMTQLWHRWWDRLESPPQPASQSPSRPQPQPQP